MTIILLSCWEYSRNHEHVLPVTVFWQFGHLVDSKVGFNPPFHSIHGPLDCSGPCSIKQATFSTHLEEQGPIYLVMLYAGHTKKEGVVTGCRESIQTNANSLEDIRVPRTKCKEEPTMVRAETG